MPGECRRNPQTAQNGLRPSGHTTQPSLGTPAAFSFLSRAFGFERMMDTLGAIVGPATALSLLALLGHNYPRIFVLTLIPGLRLVRDG